MLNLTATKTEEIIIKDYLESNASEVLTDKINNGICIEKDGKTLVNKKTLATFMNYACEEARKQADKGAKFACVGDTDVFAWAMHYFEEDSIEGTLYNEDGTEYKSNKAVTTKPAVKQTALRPELMSLFDMIDEPKKETELTEFEVDNEPEEIPQINEPEYSTPIKTIPEFIIKLFGDTLKIEVDR